ncbi:MAG: class I SAM-dependent methyltransferase [Burkholderiaceae bacterium]|nr:class I SAM-dependent methyltransferase [Burkholderiaceae bacterium]
MEVGVGSGRFAQALGIECGVDPAPEMAKHARSRGINASVGYGENLPYPDTSFDGVLMVCTICFVENAGEVLSERSRVLKPGAHLLIGFVPLDSVWGSVSQPARQSWPYVLRRRAVFFRGRVN